MQSLISILKRIDGKGYKAYKDLAGSYRFNSFSLYVDYVQGDPFASPSRVRVRVPGERAGFPEELWSSRPKRVGLQDYLIRRIADKIKEISRGSRGTGSSGLIFIDTGGQEILERTALVLTPDYVEARLSIGLPARGRTVMAKSAIIMLTEELPRIIQASLFYNNIPQEEAARYVSLKEDQSYIREQLLNRNLVCFIANGSILPRQSGVTDKPLTGKVIPFQAPSDLEVTLDLPKGRTIKGMGIPQGVTLIVGGGYHGKSTLLKAIERGVYDHVPGDGRELVITRQNAVKIRAEDGRRVEKVNISPFINNLPFGLDTGVFRTEDASGSTSQAANIVEALEIGTDLLLLDEDTSATNFMIRDARMQALVAKEKEPITPFVDKVRQLYEEKGVSTILVMGGSGDYFEAADLVILMDEYKALNITAKAKAIAAERPTKRDCEGGNRFGVIKKRVPQRNGFRPERGGKIKVSAKGLKNISFGVTNIELALLEQLVDPSQTRAIADFILYMSQNYVNNKTNMVELITKVYQEIVEKGLDVISPFYGQHPGDYAMPRVQEVAAAVNRLRTLKMV